MILQGPCPEGSVDGVLLLVLQLLLILTLEIGRPRVNEFDLNSAVADSVPEHNHIVLSVHSYDVPDIHISPSNTSPILPPGPLRTSMILAFLTDQQHVCVIEELLVHTNVTLPLLRRFIL